MEKMKDLNRGNALLAGSNFHSAIALLRRIITGEYPETVCGVAEIDTAKKYLVEAKLHIDWARNGIIPSLSGKEKQTFNLILSDIGLVMVRLGKLDWEELGQDSLRILDVAESRLKEVRLILPHEDKPFMLI